jgi:hypothetical protein
MRIQTSTISTKELQQALRDFCAANGGIPDTVIIQSYSSQIVVSLRPGGMITADEINHSVTGAEK